MIRKDFDSLQQAYNWITGQARDDAHLDLLQEELTFNYTMSGDYFIDLLSVV